MVRTRIAPSPTGFPHIGTIYQAMIDKAYALKHGGRFIVRIEDTDRSRFVENAENEIYEALNWFDLTPDESPVNPGEYGPYRQSEKLDVYKKYAEELIEKGHAYYCFCSKERLEEVRKNQQTEGKVPMYNRHCRNIPLDEAKKRVADGEEHVIRIKIPDDKKIVVNDLIRGDIEFDSNSLDDFVVIKADGFPTYHLAFIIDDHDMKINPVVRGPEWIPSFPKHKIIYEYFGWEMPQFVHTPLITNMDGSKLSKRHGHSSVDWYRRRGFLPEAVLNFISLLGWSHPEEKEIFNFGEYVSVFDLKDLSTVSPKFDLDKLEWMNGQYIQSIDNKDLLARIIEWLNYCVGSEFKGAAEYKTDWSDKEYNGFLNFLDSLSYDKDLQTLFIEINKERMKKFEDLLVLNRFFIEDIEFDYKLITAQRNGSEVAEHLKWVLDKIENLDWSLENLKSLEKEIVDRASELGWKVGEVFYPIRVAICGSKVSPPLFESIYILGKEKSIERIKTAAEELI